MGAVDVVDIVAQSDNEWIGAPVWPVLSNAAMCDPVPATGAVEYDTWAATGFVKSPAPWMRKWARLNGHADTPDLFGPSRRHWS